MNGGNHGRLLYGHASDASGRWRTRMTVCGQLPIGVGCDAFLERWGHMRLNRLKRRDVVTILGSMAVAWPFVAHAQQPAMPVVGLLGSTSPDTFAIMLAAFRKGLSEAERAHTSAQLRRVAGSACRPRGRVQADP